MKFPRPTWTHSSFPRRLSIANFGYDIRNHCWWLASRLRMLNLFSCFGNWILPEFDEDREWSGYTYPSRNPFPRD